MGRSDDSISRRRSKRSRRKQQDKGKENSNQVSLRVAAIIAAKKRRLTGKRRLCQGMCYSLPTVEDPFNETLGKPPQNKGITKKPKLTNPKNSGMRMEMGNGGDIDSHLGDCPSKFLIACLNGLEKPIQQDRDRDKPFLAHPWGIDFWKAYSRGGPQRLTQTRRRRAHATVQDIAWIAATSTDAIATKEKQGHSFASPFLLFLVPTQHRASQLRQIFKPLKDCGIRTVSLHSAASIDHQVHGLKSCEPEFVISTPERLLELVSLNAIDITGISVLVIEKPGAVSEGGYSNAIESIKDSVPASSYKVVFSDSQ